MLSKKSKKTNQKKVTMSFKHTITPSIVGINININNKKNVMFCTICDRNQHPIRTSFMFSLKKFQMRVSNIAHVHVLYENQHDRYIPCI